VPQAEAVIEPPVAAAVQPVITLPVVAKQTPPVVPPAPAAEEKPAVAPAAQVAPAPQVKGKKAPAKAAAPRPMPPADAQLSHQDLARYIDEEVSARLQAEGIEPSPRADDAEFLRRVYLDLTGVIPTTAKARAFLDSNDPNKRA